jgi:hypothetical protein
MAESASHSESKSRGPSKATVLVKIATQRAKLFHDGDEPYARVVVRTHIETWPVRSKHFKAWLAASYYQSAEKAASGEALGSAINTIIGECARGPQHKVYLRIAGSDGKIYLDLANDDWEIVEISTAGWKLIPSKDAPASRQLCRCTVEVADPKSAFLDCLAKPAGYLPVFMDRQ